MYLRHLTLRKSARTYTKAFVTIVRPFHVYHQNNMQHGSQSLWKMHLNEIIKCNGESYLQYF